MQNQTILIADDEVEILNVLEIFLRGEGYKVVKATTGRQVLEVLESEQVDLVVLDIMMPELDGIRTCVRIRESRYLPIIMLSAKSQDVDKIMGLSTGADDYVTKPFNPLELVARVKSQLRRYTQFNLGTEPKTEGRIEIDGLTIDSDTHEVSLEGVPVKLTPREFEILELLARNRGVVFSNEKLYERVWKEPFFDSANTVMVHIRKIREKIEANTRRPKYIKTVWGVGYKIDR